jgi:arginyl-tRNA synthetase
MDYKKMIAEKLSAVNGQPVSPDLIEIPPNPAMGDFAFPCFSLAKVYRKAPPVIAGELAEKLEALGGNELFSEIRVTGGYLNFFVDKSAMAKAVLGEIAEQGEAYGCSSVGAGRKVLVEFSSPNVAKPFHIGHLVSTALGSSIERIYKALGYDTVKINHIGDWGTQFGKLISAYKRWGDMEAIKKDPINELLKIYVKFHKEAELHPELDDEARDYFRRLEEGDPEVTELWKFFVQESLKEFNRMYGILGISFDSYAGESFYSDKMPAVVQELKEKHLLEESEGAQVVRFEDENIPPCIILKSDGTTIYATRDIAAAIYRKTHYDFYKNIYVVGIPQTLHFKQVFGTLEKMGKDWAKDCVHVGFGYVRFPDKSMSTRHGDVVLLEDVLKEAVSKTKAIIQESATCKILDDVDEVARKIGVGAVLFAFLKNGRERDIIFTWKDMLDFEGESGPYAQYSYARGRSILRKADELGISYSDPDFGLLTSNEDFALVKILNRFGDAIREAADKYEPCIVTRYIIDLAQQFNKFYNNCNIMKSEGALQKARLGLVAASCQCLKSALNLIGAEVVEQM